MALCTYTKKNRKIVGNDFQAPKPKRAGKTQKKKSRQPSPLNLDVGRQSAQPTLERGEHLLGRHGTVVVHRRRRRPIADLLHQLVVQKIGNVALEVQEKIVVPGSMLADEAAAAGKLLHRVGGAACGHVEGLPYGLLRVVRMLEPGLGGRRVQVADQPLLDPEQQLHPARVAGRVPLAVAHNVGEQAPGRRFDRVGQSVQDQDVGRVRRRPERVEDGFFRCASREAGRELDPRC